MSHGLDGSSALRRFKGSDMIEIHDGITFDFYTGLPHVLFFSKFLVAMIWAQRYFAETKLHTMCAYLDNTHFLNDARNTYDLFQISEST